MINSLPPGFIMFIGAFLIPFLPKISRQVYMIFLVILSTFGPETIQLSSYWSIIKLSDSINIFSKLLFTLFNSWKLTLFNSFTSSSIPSFVRVEIFIKSRTFLFRSDLLTTLRHCISLYLGSNFLTSFSSKSICWFTSYSELSGSSR